MTDCEALSLLIVEDEALILRAICLAVEAVGHTVHATAATLPEAFNVAEAVGDEIDAALLDFNLRGLQSGPLVKDLQAKGVPVLILTGYSEVEIQAAGLDAPVLSKPFRKREIAEALLALTR